MPQRFTYDGEDAILAAYENSTASTANVYVPGIDNKAAWKASTESWAQFPLADHLGTPAGSVGLNSAVTTRPPLDSFGNGGVGDFTGREYDYFTGLYYYRARMYDPALGRFTAEDPIGFEGGGINQYAYVSNIPQNATDPFGLYEIDVHYYLTLYLALRTGCFSQTQAVAIANGDQMTDENPSESPDFNKRYQNATYHALNPDAYPGQLSSHLLAMATRPQINLSYFGRSVHYLQDTYSHAGFTSNIYGHAFAGHMFDKTISDPDRAFQMAFATWNALNDFGKKLGCECEKELSSSELGSIGDFIGAPGSATPSLNAIDSAGGTHDFLITNPGSYLDRKRSILGLPPR